MKCTDKHANPNLNFVLVFIIIGLTCYEVVAASFYSQEILHVPHLSRRGLAADTSTAAHHQTPVVLQLICRLALGLPDFNFGSIFDSPSGDALGMQFSLTGQLLPGQDLYKNKCV